MKRKKMATYTLGSRDVPLNNDYEVIVVGGGPAGCTAAAAAAREGAQTLLIEATGALGGMGTNGLVPAWCPFSDKEKIIYRGLAERVFNETKSGMAHIQQDKLDWVAINPELLKRVYDDLVTEFGAKILFNTMLSAVETNGNGRVEAIIVSNKSGLTAYTANVYIDSTGDADLCAWAGAECEKGDPETGGMQPATHCFMIANVDTYAYEHGPRFQVGAGEGYAVKMSDDENYPLIIDSHSCNSLLGAGVVGFNTGHIYNVDNTDPVNLSEAHIHGRKMAAQYRDALAEYMPQAFGQGFLAATGSLMGIRETRRVIGDYVLTLDDYVNRASFEDEVCRNAYYLDVHLSFEDRRKFDHGDDEIMKKRDLRYEPGESHGIPYRCFTPRDLKNVLVAGRNISTDRRTQGSTRVMPVCLAMGEAAGMAAAHSLSIEGNDVHNVDVKKLRERLKEEGAYLP
jgi:glycine/D-amino acid oxidase-like deaminating enzyme